MSRETGPRWFGMVICGKVVVWGGLGLTWQVDVIIMLLNLFFKNLY